MTQAIRYEKGQDGIVVLTLDMPGQSANTMNGAYREAMAAMVERLEAQKDDLAGVVITSAKKTFFAGGDLNELIKVDKAHAKDLRKERRGEALAKRGRRDAPAPRKPASPKKAPGPKAKPGAKPVRPAPKAPKR